MTTKRCVKCKMIKSVSEFSRLGDGHQAMCRECFRKYYEDHKEHMKEIKRQWYSRLKQEVAREYGSACVCCGETELAFLTLDHVRNDGARHREEIGVSSRGTPKGGTLWHWAAKNGCPSDLQLLCANCNMAKHFNPGGCPHWPDGSSTSVHQRINAERVQ